MQIAPMPFRVLDVLSQNIFKERTQGDGINEKIYRHSSKFTNSGRDHRSGIRTDTTSAIVAGGAGAGALIGGKKGAAIGAGGAGLYAFNRGAARRHFKHSTRTVGTVASGTALGAGVGAAAGHGKGAAIGAAVGAGSSYIYSRSRRARRRY